MPDGSQRKGTSWQTSPMDIAKEISKSLADRMVISQVDGELWDLERPLEKSCSLQLLDFEHPEGMLSPVASIKCLTTARQARILAFVRTRPRRVRRA